MKEVFQSTLAMNKPGWINDGNSNRLIDTLYWPLYLYWNLKKADYDAIYYSQDTN
jgi:hypothetical protein